MVDYSKWDNIEISDDEDEPVPFIDNPTLFNLRHGMRIERMTEMEREKKEFEEKKRSHQGRLVTVKERLQKKEGNEEELKNELNNIEKEGEDLSRLEEKLIKKEKSMPLNVDTISKPGYEKTLINKEKSDEFDYFTEIKHVECKTVLKNKETLCMEYGMLRTRDESRRFLSKNPHLVCEETVNFMSIWCLHLQTINQEELMAHVAHQCVYLQHIVEQCEEFCIRPDDFLEVFCPKVDFATTKKDEFDRNIDCFITNVRERAQEYLNREVFKKEKRCQGQPYREGDVIEDKLEMLFQEMERCFKARRKPNSRDPATR